MFSVQHDTMLDSTKLLKKGRAWKQIDLIAIAGRYPQKCVTPMLQRLELLVLQDQIGLSNTGDSMSKSRRESSHVKVFCGMASL